ncbi:MAG TPA: anti-sigma factor [Chitinophagaceae bacterium]
MNIQEYISSGIIESYVLGLATPEEAAEFESMCRQNPQIVEARRQFELQLEQKAMEGRVEPASELKNSIWTAIKRTGETHNPKIVNMEPTPKRRSSFLGWVAAASIALLIVAGYLAYSFYQATQALKKDNADLEARVNSMSKEQEIMHDPNATVVNLVGLKGTPSSANVYWDSTSADVYMIVKNMPMLPGDKQYQLWALINNKPVDLGLFDPPGNKKVILKMKNTQKADAFAITIENRGNSGGPTLDQLQSMGRAKL